VAEAERLGADATRVAVAGDSAGGNLAAALALLARAGVDVTCTRYDGMLHGFFGLREIVPDSDRAVAEVAAFLRRHC
jgi:acetyl esterase/lipase